MTTGKEYSDNAKREIGIDVEALLQAIHQRTSGEVQELIDNEQSHRVSVGGIAYDSYSELAQAFELDIHDYAITELNR